MSATSPAKFWLTLSAALALGLFLQWPSLQGGFRSDDFVQRAMLHGVFPAPRSVFDLFDFARGTPDDYARLVDYGHLPWWAAPQLRLRMWRPLASALMALDDSLFGADARLQHAHSLLWFALLLFAAARLFFRLLPAPIAGLALLLFAAGPCHTMPVGWLANRSTLIATSLGFFALELQLGYAARPSWPRALGCALLTAAALLAGEYAIGALAYVFAFAWLGVPAGTRAYDRMRTVMPVLVPLVGYLALHSLLGADIVHSGYYLSPLRDPAGFTRALFTRVPVLASDLLFGLPALYWNGGSPLRGWLLSSQLISPELWLRLPAWSTWHTAIGFVALGAGVLLWRALRAHAPDVAALRWLGPGALLALLPYAGSLPEDRLLAASTLGSAALIATALVRFFRSVRLAPLFALALWVPVSSLYRSYNDVRAVVFGSDVARAWCLQAELPEGAAAAHTRVYLLAAGDFNSAVNLPWLRWTYGHALPQSYRRLCPGPLPTDITRENERSLLVRVLTVNLRGTAVPSLYRAGDAPVRLGDRVRLPGLLVEVLGVYDDNPTQLRFTFDRSLDDPALWFLIATEHGLAHSRMPAIGQTVRVPFAQYRDIRKPK